MGGCKGFGWGGRWFGHGTPHELAVPKRGKSRKGSGKGWLGGWGGCKGFGSGVVGGRGTGPRDGANFATCVYKKKKNGVF